MKTENFLKYCSIILNKPYKNVEGIVNGEYIIFACTTLPPVRIKKCLIEVLRDEK